MEPLKKSYTITELSEYFNVSSRTIRYYEEKGLISPGRTKGNQRRYSAHDRFRLKWILRGKRFGFSLEEISKILKLTDTDTDHVQQIKTTLKYGEKKLQEIDERIQELKILKTDMLALKEKLLSRLNELGKLPTVKTPPDPSEVEQHIT